MNIVHYHNLLSIVNFQLRKHHIKTVFVCCLGSGANVLGDVSHMTIPQLEEWGVGLNIGIAWEDALHSALMPITPQASMGSLADGKLSFSAS